MRARALFAVFALLLLAACEGEPPKTALGYTADAKRAYEAAMQEFDAHNWIDAQSMMREVKRKYSYSKYARLAELRIADADFMQEKYSESIREYKDFVHAHRADVEDVAYARSKIAEATYAEIPESLLLPASEERDQASVVDAYKELRDFVSDYPTGKDTPHIRDLLAQVTARLVRHELYVARFYLRKDNYDAAVARVMYALRNYGEAMGGPQAISEAAELQAEALVLLGTTYLMMHKWPEARGAFGVVVARYAQTPYAVDARNYIAYMNERGV
ncbi:MAG TPA: outer membrane protein assembly factor BamD [Polyangiaceae bacterium]|nr:outer membrane protein assembly factor BamD [Polyangiaceae bacterium]